MLLDGPGRAYLPAEVRSQRQFRTVIAGGQVSLGGTAKQWSVRARIPVVLVVFALLGAPSASRAAAPDCIDGNLAGVTTGAVVRTSCASDALGGDASFSYYIPADCTATNRCPVLYLLHGFGNDDREMLGTHGAPSVFVKALTADPVTGTPKPPLDFILVAPEGRTVAAGGDGPPAGQESFWVDWNPRYTTRAPEFEQHVTRELLGLVDRSMPTIANREGRAIAGVSLGGFGAFKLALQHPDLYANTGSISGALNILVAPDVQPIPPPQPVPGLLPADAPAYVEPPGVIKTPPGFPFGDPFRAFGDPVADEAYFRGNNPLDLAINAHATGCGDDGCEPLRFFHNDTVPAPEDVASPQSWIGAQALEDAVLPMNTEMRAALTQDGVPFAYELHSGIHEWKYWNPYVRAQLEWNYARVSHTAAMLEPVVPTSFDYRSIRGDFSVWGWHVHVDRTPREFLTLWNASAGGVDVTGSGRVTIITPPLGITGVKVAGYDTDDVSTSIGPDGHAEITLTLGPSGPTDEHLGTTGLPGVASTARILFVR